MSSRSCFCLLLWVLVSVFCPGTVRADETTIEVGGQRFRIRHWTTEDGLPQHHINCLKQTRDGYLWIGTWFGLVRFDGVRFTAFNENHAPELGDAVNDLVEDREGTLWIGTHKGLVRYQDRRFESVPLPEKIRDLKVQRLEENPNGGIWIQLGVGPLVLLRDGKFSKVWELPLSEHDRITEIVSAADGVLTVLTRFASFAVSPDASRMSTNITRFAEIPNIYRAAPAKKRGEMWLATEEGLYHLKNNSATNFRSDLFNSTFIDMTYQDRSSNVWVAVREGPLFCYDGENWSNVPLLGPSETVTPCCMEQDFENNWWVGTAEGLFQIRKLPIRTHTTKGGLGSNQAFSISEGSPGSIWVATEGGLARIRSNRVEKLWATPGRKTRNSVALVWACTNDVVWTTTGLPDLFRFEKDHFSIASNANNSTTNIISCLWRAPSGAFYCCSSDGVFVFNDNKPIPWRSYAATYSITNARAMLQEPDGTLWFAPEDKGLAKVQGQTIKYLNVQNGLSSSNVWAIHQDRDGVLWVGTENGLTRIKNGKFFPITRQHGLVENTVNCVLEDDFGSLWLVGLQRLYRLERDQLNNFADGLAQSFDCYAYGIADGMVSPETNGEHQPAACKASDGRLWFPTLHGVIVLDPKLINRKEAAPQVLIEQVWADRKVIFGDGNTNLTQLSKAGTLKLDGFWPLAPAKVHPIRLSPGSARVLDFRFTANTLIASEHARFRYRLIGADKAWCPPVSEREVHYENLKPGSYRFEVKAGNYHNVWSTQPATFEFSIAPHFWQTSTFYGGCAAGIFALGAAIQAYRLRWLRRLWKLEEQRALASQRTRIARDLHDDLGTALTGLALELDVTGRNANSGVPITDRLRQTAQRTRHLAERMREVVWSVNPRCDTVSSLASFLEQQVEQFLNSDKVQIRLDFPENIPDIPLGAEPRHQLSLCVREGLSNVVRHSGATRATISLRIQDGTLLVEIQDNGRGLLAHAGNGNGLRNMLARMESVGGTFDYRSSPGCGTTLIFSLKLPSHGI